MKTNRTAFILFTLLLALITMTFMACSKEAAHDYSADPSYAAFFSEADDAAAKEMKNLMLKHFEAYNAGDAETFYSLFDMEKDDFNFNVAQMKSIMSSCKITYTPEEIVTAFINDDNAQAMITVTCRGDDIQTGEVLYYYRTDITYTLQRNGEWKILQQQNSGEFDLMDTLDSETGEITGK